MIHLARKSTPQRTLIGFSFRQSIKGTVGVALVACLELIVQGVAYQKTYSTLHAQAKFAATLAKAPGLGFIYGDPANLNAGTAGYMVYRVLGFFGVIAAVWAVVSISQQLRGCEEDGRWELIRSEAISSARANWSVLVGFVYAWLVSVIVAFIITFGAFHGDHISITPKALWLLDLAILLPGFAFAGVGVLVSQLAQSRGRALIYGIVPIGILFLLRGVANTDSASWHWLLYVSPFGWAQLINPVLGPNTAWLLALAAFGIVFALLGLKLTDRDYGESVILESQTATSHYGFLGRPWQLALRQNSLMLTGWTLGALILISLISALASTATSAIKSSVNLNRPLHKLGGGSNNIEIAFLGAGILFMIMVLLTMSIHILGSVRRDEAKQYLDSILVAPKRRTTWLASRLILAFGCVLLVSLLGGFAMLIIAHGEHISLDFWKVIATCVCAVGTVGFLIGFGALLYGILPRLTMIGMYVVIGWSFLIILLSSAAKLNSLYMHSTLFNYTNFNLANWPDWSTFGWMMVSGIILSLVGIYLFNRRDIVPE